MTDPKRKTWQLQEAKARFSEVVDRALEGETQVVTRHGKNAVAVVPYDEYERLTRDRRSLLEVLGSAPFELVLERDRRPARPAALD